MDFNTQIRYEAILNQQVNREIEFILKLMNLRLRAPLQKTIDLFKIEVVEEFFENFDYNQFNEIIDILITNIDEIRDIFANTIIRNLFQMSGDEVSEFLEKIGKIKENVIDTKKIEQLILKTRNDFDNIINSLKNYRDYFIQTKSGISDRIINEAIAKGILKKETINMSKKELFETFKNIFANQNFININGRNYSLKNYSELVVRTRSREAQTIGTLEHAFQYNVYLFRFSRHPEPCKICAPYEDKIIYVRESDKKKGRYSIKVAQPPLHPNCMHVLFPYIDDEEI